MIIYYLLFQNPEKKPEDDKYLIILNPDLIFPYKESSN